jgi:hypothetical protein
MSEQRAKRGLRDLVLSLGVVGLFVAFLYAVVWRPAPEPVRTVDPAETLRLAESDADYEVLAPEGLSGQWRATAARYEPTSDGSVWFLGYVTPDDQYVAVAQTDGDPEGFIEEQTLSGAPDGLREIDDEQWQQYAADDQRSLVRATDESTTVVTGTVDYGRLQDFVLRLS